MFKDIRFSKLQVLFCYSFGIRIRLKVNILTILLINFYFEIHEILYNNLGEK